MKGRNGTVCAVCCMIQIYLALSCLRSTRAGYMCPGHSELRSLLRERLLLFLRGREVITGLNWCRVVLMDPILRQGLYRRFRPSVRWGLSMRTRSTSLCSLLSLGRPFLSRPLGHPVGTGTAPRPQRVALGKFHDRASDRQSGAFHR
ncbi:uncharacterized protein ARMOST_18939 [Armillaria ostoyae]|uniref:Secreted protein n=1 Tax=Armillaria ostoyae TaxID=47428 RepID=A0A284S359_ARMOS|nr:uncharacterized protein ARMOST_18939 [Armillaria ostoyae]